MKLFYKATKKERLEARKVIFLKQALPALQKSGFERSPFSTAWFGYNNLKDLDYTLCRLTQKGQLETIWLYACREDRWVKIHLNIFQLVNAPTSLEQLKNLDGLQFELPPNSLTRMRLRSDDYQWIPLVTPLLMPKHKLYRYFTRAGFHHRVAQLGRLVEKDMTDIDQFVKRWHEIHKPLKVDWQGHAVK